MPTVALHRVPGRALAAYLDGRRRDPGVKYCTFVNHGKKISVQQQAPARSPARENAGGITMRDALRCMPIYLLGSLQYFADVREANHNCSSVSRRNDAEGGSSSGAFLPRDAPCIGDAVRSFNLDACFAMPDGLRQNFGEGEV